MNVYRFCGNVKTGDVWEWKSVIKKVTKKNRIFLEGDAITSNPFEGMKFGKFSQFNMIGFAKDFPLYEMYSLGNYYQYDKSKFLRLFAKKRRKYEEKLLNSI